MHKALSCETEDTFPPYSRFGNKVGLEKSCLCSLVFASSPVVCCHSGVWSSTASSIMGMFCIKLIVPEESQVSLQYSKIYHINASYLFVNVISHEVRIAQGKLNSQNMC